MTISEATYRDLANRDVLACAIVTVAAKLPMSMTPLMMVFLTRGLPGGYVLAAALTAVYVLGELLGAAILGLLLDPSKMRGQLATGLAIGAVAFSTLALTTNVTVLAVAAFIAGAAPSTTPGGLRAMLLGLVPDALVPKAMGFDAMITQVVWVVAPALVTVLALNVDRRTPVVVSVCLIAVAAWLVFILPRGHVTSRVDKAKTKTVVRAWPIYLVSAAALAQLAVAELVLPALLEHRGIGIGWTGPLLTGFAACGALGAVLYGLRPWPGSLRAQGLVLLVLTATCVGAVALFPNLPGIAGALLAAGLFQSGVLVTRSLVLRERLPIGSHAAAFSLMYTVTSAGYGLTAVVAAWALHEGSPIWAVFGGVAVTLVLTAISAAAERRQPR